MQYFLALFFLGLIQGLTEFLPVSSSGHLVLFSQIFGIEESLFISILLHVATLLSIVVVFYKDIWQMIRHPLSKQTMMLVVATIPTCLIVLVIMPLIKQSFAGGLLPICFLNSAILLLVSEMLSKRKTCMEMNYKTAFFMGVAQGFAVFPGISRSGTTISAGLMSGGQKEGVAKFSFLMSVPIVFLSLIMEIYEIVVGKVALEIQVLPTIVSFITAFVVGIVSIKLMIKLTVKSSLKWFSVYLVIIAVVSAFIL